MDTLTSVNRNLSFEELSGWKMDDPSTFSSFDFETNSVRWLFLQAYKIGHFGACLAFLYIVVIIGLQRWMQKRQPYDLKFLLFLWNIIFACFSIVVFVRISPGQIKVLSRKNGLYDSICVRDGLNPQTAFWGILFGLSKVAEFGDTMFIILRKRQLIFIHWYHHLTSMLLSWTTGYYMEPINRWHGFVNSGVHSVMYAYFAAKTIGLNAPVILKKFITTIQFAQMLIFLGIHLTSFYFKVYATECAREPSSIMAYTILFITYTILFGRLFCQTYSFREAPQIRLKIE